MKIKVLTNLGTHFVSKDSIVFENDVYYVIIFAKKEKIINIQEVKNALKQQKLFE